MTSRPRTQRLVVRRLIRYVILALVRLCYRLRVRGRRHVPRHGAALLVCNHVSYMDALVLGGACSRPLRFVMDRPIYDSPWLKWLFLLVGAIPIESERRDPGALRRALDDISKALANGEVVMVFPEGRLTTNGEVQRFRRGLETILERNTVPVIPAGLAGLWGSWTSHCGGPALSKPPGRFRARVSLHFGEPVDPRAVQNEALCRYFEARVRVLKAGADEEICRGEAD
ncbi:1-acyl-sn-glycerol-3-phosphate acyltransferase [Halomonas piscis]|uniref:1-acyl-sn-glycerol-3-phosphate acyltransferase n=1 Tax=Halomonas piscis TaxID=3031727 RepID=A0ABY9Z0P0_9GAMM|nr:1-acyl-sn-glycerol-3-phosphate acyltransferase [Halomonas piscis]WNK20709.1 1-acyl-sn-glycerol-3-phosphate acyltransferase [Halomonas piscis]